MDCRALKSVLVVKQNWLIWINYRQVSWIIFESLMPGKIIFAEIQMDQTRFSGRFTSPGNELICGENFA